MQEVPVLPVLAKADCMTTGELESFRELVRNTLHHVSMLQMTVNIRMKASIIHVGVSPLSINACQQDCHPICDVFWIMNTQHLLALLSMHTYLGIAVNKALPMTHIRTTDMSSVEGSRQACKEQRLCVSHPL